MLMLERDVAVDPRMPLSDRELGSIVDKLLRFFGAADSAVALRLVDDREMMELNRAFLGCLGPTNILSFPAGDNDAPGDQPERLGDLILSVDTVAREAFLYNQDYHEYTVRLLAHGLLHLAGYDHGTEMDDLTEQAVAIIGKAGAPAILFSSP